MRRLQKLISKKKFIEELETFKDNDLDEVELENQNNNQDEPPMVLMRAIDTIEEVLDMTNYDMTNYEDIGKEIVKQKSIVSDADAQTKALYVTRAGRVSKPTQRYGFEQAFAIVKEWYKENYKQL